MSGDPAKVVEKRISRYPELILRTNCSMSMADISGRESRTGNIILTILKEYENKEGQAVRYGENILDITKYIKAEDIKTCIIPLGATNSRYGKGQSQ